MISFSDFKKDPMKAVMFAAICAIGYLYVDNRSIHSEQRQWFENQLNKKEARIKDLEKKVDDLYKIISNR